VELVAPWSADALHEGWLSAEEQAAVGALAPHHRAEAVTRSWTQKEAVLKGRGTGLAGGPAQVPTPVGHGAGRVSGWDVATVAVPAGHVATVATRPRRATICARPSSTRIRGSRP
jgi:4'-phosphopantetheinyl transferase